MLKRFFLTLCCVAGLSQAHAICIQSTIFDGILKINVDKDGSINYDAIRINKGGDLYQYISFIENADLTKCTEPEREAFWINAYNAHLIRLVLARVNLKQINDDFKLFGEKFKVANQKLSLNDIEHRVLRSSAKNGGPIAGVSVAEFDPRIHFALTFGAKDSPKLYNRAYTPQNLETALQNNAVNFANSPKHVHLEGDTLFVSSLLRWYAGDFAKFGGPGVYLGSLIDPKVRPDGQQIIDKLKTDFPDKTQFRFDWTLNKKEATAAPAPAN